MQNVECGLWGISHNPGQTHLNCCKPLNTSLLFESPRFGGGSVQQSHGQRNDGQGNDRHDFGFIPCQTFPGPFFSLVSGRAQILHFVAVRVKLDASALHSVASGLDKARKIDFLSVLT